MHTAGKLDRSCMERCLLEAARGAGQVSPNPMVGALVEREGKILGIGWHEVFGGAHAEVNALRNAALKNHDVKDAVLYVTLEPCAHYGNTPPCVDAIVESGISEVVIGMKDPNPLVAGRGIRLLAESGIKVRVGVCEDECAALNEKYIVSTKRRRPFVAIKTAMTADGFIASANAGERYITSQRSLSHVHLLRSRHDAILVGAGTVAADDPRLTVRHRTGKNPARIVVDGKFSSSLDARVYTDEYRILTILYVARERVRAVMPKIREVQARGVTVVALESTGGVIPVAEILDDLRRKGIASILVEGGAAIYEQFLKARCADRAYVFVSPKKYNTGTRGIDWGAARARLHVRQRRRFLDDRYLEAAITYGGLR
jgi:diaminohydroxyphosphoribosylaminopyrimidine deaminase / 5-amino-6-(5-phosphoribosylamino)uracil reductase